MIFVVTHHKTGHHLTGYIFRSFGGRFSDISETGVIPSGAEIV